MYAKSGMMERYLLPTTFGFAFLVIGMLKKIKIRAFRVVNVFVVFVFIALSFSTAIISANTFTKSGKETNELLLAVRNKINQKSNILLVVDPVDSYEVSWSARTYYSYYGFDNFFAFPIKREYKSEFEYALEKQWELWFKDKMLSDINSLPDVIILINKNQTDQFFQQSGLHKEDYMNLLSESNVYAAFYKR